MVVQDTLKQTAGHLLKRVTLPPLQEPASEGLGHEPKRPGEENQVLLVLLPIQDRLLTALLSSARIALGDGDRDDGPQPLPPSSPRIGNGLPKPSATGWDQGALASAEQPLTAQEQRILTLVGRGYSNKLVAEALDLSQQTVKNYVHTIMRKLGAHNRAHAVTIALQRHWLRMEALAVGAAQKEQSYWE